MTGTQRLNGSQSRLVGTGIQAVADDRVKSQAAGGKVLRQEPARELNGDEVMGLSRKTAGGKRFISLPVKSRSPGLKRETRIAQPDLSSAAEIQAEFEAVRMETRRPIHFLIRPQLVPFKTHPQTGEVTKKLAPPCPSGPPQHRLTAVDKTWMYSDGRRHVEPP